MENMQDQEMFLNAARELLPDFNNQITDEDILKVYQQLRAELPDMPIEELIKQVSAMVPQILAKLNNAQELAGENQPEKLDALRNMRG